MIKITLSLIGCAFLIVFSVLLWGHAVENRAGQPENPPVYFQIQNPPLPVDPAPVSACRANRVAQKNPEKPLPSGKTAMTKPPAELNLPPKSVVQTESGPGSGTQEPEFMMYGTRKEDTLWNIAAEFYGHGRYYPVLLEHNPHAGIYTVGEGLELKILKDPALARDIYGRIVKKEKGQVYWCHTVAEGDTLQAIAGRYFRNGRMKVDIAGLGNATQLNGGETIWILLE